MYGVPTPYTPRSLCWLLRYRDDHGPGFQRAHVPGKLTCKTVPQFSKMMFRRMGIRAKEDLVDSRGEVSFHKCEGVEVAC